MRKLGLLLTILFGAAIGTMVSGCNDNDPTGQDGDMARVMFVHAGKDLAGVDLKLGGSTVALGRAYTDFTTYLDVNEGSVQAQILTAGTSTSLATETLNLEGGKSYTLFAASDASGNADLVPFTDNLVTPAAGKARVRVAHMMADGPAIKVAIMQVGPFASNVVYKDNTQAFHEVNAGSVTIRVQDNTVSGNQTGGQAPLLEEEVAFEAGKNYTLVIRGKLSDGSKDLFLLPHN